MASIEGRRGQPRPRPPFPAQSGLWGFPTLINNVETFANIVPIISRGADWYATLGTEKSKGTKVFALTGKIRNNGLIEVPMGITIRQIVEDLGGGTPDGTKIKAVQTGGPSGGCIPAELFDTPVDYDSLMKVGSIMGSGGMVVMSENTNMVDVAKFYMEFCMEESCGKCIPCRAGTVQMHRLLSKILERKATAARPRIARGTLRHGQEHQPLRPRPDRSKSCPQHPSLLPQRVCSAPSTCLRRSQPTARPVKPSRNRSPSPRRTASQSSWQ